MIISYDSPWNPVRLIQRRGRVNRIDTKAEYIYSYVFYPSKDGDKHIELYKNSLIKLQGFHSALGEDEQIYSWEEEVRNFKFFDEEIEDKVDKKLELLREVRELHEKNKKEYNRIKNLAPKISTFRAAKCRPQDLDSQTTIAYLANGRPEHPDNLSESKLSIHQQFYKIRGNSKPEPIDFVQAAEWLRAEIKEKRADSAELRSLNYAHVRKACDAYEQELSKGKPEEYTFGSDKQRSQSKALNMLDSIMGALQDDQEMLGKGSDLKQLVRSGTISKLTRDLTALQKKYKNMYKKKTVRKSKLN